METYVHEGIEVGLTGRTAKKEATRRTTRGKVPSIDILVEITPIDKETGSWKKWIKKEELYKINK